jgi:UDP-2-acetamido-2,6-beta-L-arabino-hexul-4-ose reductase
MKFVITGAMGLIGWHASSHLYAENCAAKFKGLAEPYDIVRLDHATFGDKQLLEKALQNAEVVLHFAGVNRAPEHEVEQANPDIAKALVLACQAIGIKPHIVYANSTHAASDTPYGRSKRIAGEIVAAFTPRYTNMILPHIFGECARPNYNNVTATLIDQVVAGKEPTVNPDGRVALLHASAVAQAAIEAVVHKIYGAITPEPRPISVPNLLTQLQTFHAHYAANTFPDFGDAFQVQLFNSYRGALYPSGFPRMLKINEDQRGTLFEAAKGGGGGQSFLSWTKPGVTRGNHFHIHKVERFLVLQGEAKIRIRRVFDDEVWEYAVSGEQPAAVDMPTLHTHSIENIGAEPLLTLFWTNEIFDPQLPDTYFDPVLKVKQ